MVLFRFFFFFCYFRCTRQLFNDSDCLYAENSMIQNYMENYTDIGYDKSHRIIFRLKKIRNSKQFLQLRGCVSIFKNFFLDNGCDNIILNYNLLYVTYLF